MGIDSIKRLQSHANKKEREAELTSAVTGEAIDMSEHERTLSDIYTDPVEQARFFTFLESKSSMKAQDITAMYATDTVVDPKDSAWLEKMRAEYNKNRASVESLKGMLDSEEMISRIAALDPKIKEVMGQIGAEKSAKLLGKEFEELALRNPTVYKKMTAALKGLRDVEHSDKAKELDSKVAAVLDKLGVTEADYNEALRSSLALSGGATTPESKRKLDELARQQYGWFKTAVNNVSGGSLSAWHALKMTKTFTEQKEIMEECDKHIKSIGLVLRGTLTNDMRLSIQKAMLDGSEVEGKKKTFKVNSIQDYKTIKSAFDISVIDNRFQALKSAEAKKKNIKDWTAGGNPAILDSLKEDFAKEEFKKQSELDAPGWLMGLLAFLFSGRTKDTIKSALK